MENLNKIGQLDIAVKLGLGFAATFSAAASIAIPTTKEKERSALELFDRPMAQLTPQEKRVAEFQAGHVRWTNFFGEREGIPWVVTHGLSHACCLMCR